MPYVCCVHVSLIHLCCAEELKVWRTDPGSIFDFDPLEDDIQSISLRRMTGTANKHLDLMLFVCLRRSLI